MVAQVHGRQRRTHDTHIYKGGSSTKTKTDKPLPLTVEGLGRDVSLTRKSRSVS